MKISINKDSTCGKVDVAAGDYMVALASDTGQLVFTGGGKTHKVPAVRRRSAGKTRTTTVNLIPGGGSTYSVVMSTPKQGEWIAMFEVVGGKNKDLKK